MLDQLDMILDMAVSNLFGAVGIVCIVFGAYLMITRIHREYLFGENDQVYKPPVFGALFWIGLGWFIYQTFRYF